MNQTYLIVALAIAVLILWFYSTSEEGFSWYDPYYPYDWRYNYYYRPWYKRNPRGWRRHWWWY